MENLTLADFQNFFASHPQLRKCSEWTNSLERNLKISGLSGSSLSLTAASLFQLKPVTQVFVWNDADEAAYLYNVREEAVLATREFCDTLYQ